MEDYYYSVDDLRASVEEGTRQVENGQFFTDAQAEAVITVHHRQVA